MVLHVIGHEKPVTLQPLIEGVEHLDFFLSRIVDVAGSSVHTFAESSQTKAQIEAVARLNLTFEEGAHELARRFSLAHGGSASDGAFFVIDLLCDEGSQFFCLIKYDYRPVVELAHQNERAVLRQIVQAFVRDRRAIQKCCIVRVVDGRATDEVSAVDRMGTSPDLTGYFATYLDVTRHRDEKELSDRLTEVLRRAINDARTLTDVADPGASFVAAKQSLKGRQIVDEEAVIEAVCVAVGNPSDESVRASLQKKTLSALRASNLDGVAFRPHDGFFNRKPRRKVKTAENVTIDYPGELENIRVFKDPQPDGGWKYTILTESDPVKDEIIRDTAR